MSNISYSQMAGDLKKAARLYKVFESAADAAEVLGSLEKHTKDLEGQKSSLEGALDTLNTACNTAEERQKTIEAKNDELEKQGREIIADAKDEADKVRVKAKARLDDAHGKLLSELEKVKLEVEDAKATLGDIKREHAALLSTKKKAEQELQQVKDKFFAAG